MPKGAAKKRAAEDYDSDGGFVEDAPRSKKTKNAESDMQRDEEGQPFWEVRWRPEISGKRRLQVTEFKGTVMVSIREFYEKDGKVLPGRKGISLSVDQFAAVLELLPDIERALKEKGKTVPRPNYDIGSGSVPAPDEDNSVKAASDKEVEPGDVDVKTESSGKLDKLKHKRNYEGTSDEDED